MTDLSVNAWMGEKAWHFLVALFHITCSIEEWGGGKERGKKRQRMGLDFLHLGLKTRKGKLK